MRKLNEEQLKAVKHPKGPALIIAGAGTGKTTVITERVKQLISKVGIKPSEILALTFTEKAAREMEERIDIALPYGYTQMWISTFHSFGERILRREALHIGLDPKYKLMTAAETTQFIRSNLFKFNLKYFRPLGNPTKFVSGLCQHFSRLQDEDVTPKTYLKWANSLGSKKMDREEREKWQELAEAYLKYEELKTKEGLMDYGDLITKTLELFRTRPSICRVYKRQFKHILVDEFQDTNIAQYELVKLLAPPSERPNLTVVGDDSQSIYKFRGAAVSNILYFKKDYKKASTYVLTKNYRSTQAILDSAYKLIKHNDPDTLEARLGIDKNLVSMTAKAGEPVGLIHKDRVENEAEAVTWEITNLLKDGFDYKDFAILVRANNHAEPFMRALSRRGIPYQFLGPGRLFRQPEIVDLIAYLRVLYNFEDSLALYRLLSAEFFDLDARDLAVMGNYARKHNLSLFEAAEKHEELKLSDRSQKLLEKLVEVVYKHLKLSRRESAGQILYFFLEEFNLLEALLNPKDKEVQKKSANISKFFDKLKTYEVDHDDASVTAVVDWIDLSMELGESPLSVDSDWTAVNAVNILTVHGSKGLEFPVVFLVNLVSLRFPSLERSEQIPIPDALIRELLPQGDYHVQEERRLFYVGMTRAKSRLFFTAADYYGEGKRDKKLSPFVFEALGDDALSSELKTEEGEQLSLMEFKNGKVPKKGETKTDAFHVDYLSFSQIDTFRTCPLHYKLKYILQIPTPPSGAASLGTSVHESLKDFYQKALQGTKPTPKLMGTILEDNWVKLGYRDKKHAQEAKARALNYLTDYVKNEFNPKRLPVAVEKPFTIPLPKKAGERPLKIGGKIDRVDVLPDGSIEIIDYKTGSHVPSQREVDKDLQLTFYALAASTIHEEPFNKNPQDITLTLYYFEKGEKLTTTRTKTDLANAVEEIYDWRKKMEQSDFECSGCSFKFCEFGMFCRKDS